MAHVFLIVQRSKSMLDIFDMLALYVSHSYFCRNAAVPSFPNAWIRLMMLYKTNDA